MFEFIDDEVEREKMRAVYDTVTYMNLWGMLREKREPSYTDLQSLYAMHCDDRYIRDMRYIAANGMDAFRDLHLKIVKEEDNGFARECHPQASRDEQAHGSFERAKVYKVSKDTPSAVEWFVAQTKMLCCFHDRKTMRKHGIL